MPRRSELRWQTRFGSWVHDFGVSNLVQELQRVGEPISQKGVYAWMSGDGRPNYERALVLTRISGGRVRLEDIARHRHEVRGRGQETTRP